MGNRSFSQQVAAVPKQRSLAEREDQLLHHFFEEVSSLKSWLADVGDLEALLKPEASISEPVEVTLDSFVPTTLPRDADGYVLAFEPHDPALSTFFLEHGLVVIRAALDAEACARSREEFWDLMRRESPGLDPEQPSTWNRWTDLKALGFVGMTFPLSPQLCRNRVAPRVHASFATVFGTPELHVNTGRLGAMRPTRPGAAGAPEEERPDWRTVEGGEWLHWDANPWTGGISSFSFRMQDPKTNRGHGRTSVQAIMALSDCHESNGGFFCVPGSHKVFRAYAQAHPERYRNIQSPEGPMQHQLPLGDPLQELGERAPIREGDLLIWSTELLHCNYPNESCNMRLVQYIQMIRADDLVMKPLLDDRSLLPPESEFPLTELAKRLLNFEPWPKTR